MCKFKAWRHITLVVVLGFLVVACNDKETKYIIVEPETDDVDSGGVSINADDIPGTWLFRQVSSVYSVATDEFLYRGFYEDTKFFWEQNGKLVYASCLDYQSSYPLGVILTDKYVYLNGSQAFESFGPNILRSVTTERLDDPGDPAVYIRQHLELVRLSDELLLDSGLFVLNGPVNIAEYDQICVNRGYSSFFSSQYLSLTFPFEGNRLRMQLAFDGSLPAQDYVYDENVSGQVGPISRFDIDSNSEIFWDTFGSATLDPELADISISVSNDQELMGSFSFSDSDSNMHTGEFHFIFQQ